MAGLAGWGRVYEGEGVECVGGGEEVLHEVFVGSGFVISP